MGDKNKQTLDPTRRNLMKSLGAVSGIVAVAGCQGNGGDDGDDSDGGDTPTEGDGEVADELGEQIDAVELFVVPPDEDQVDYTLAQLTAQKWRELGLDVEVKTRAFNRLLEIQVQEHSFDVNITSFGGLARRIDPDPFVYIFFHSQFTEPGGFNYTGYQSDEYDQYAEQQRTEFDRESRKEAVYNAQEVWARDQPMTPVFYQQQLHPYNNERFSNPVPMIGEGLNSFWNMIGIEPASGVSEFRWGYPSAVNHLNPILSFPTPAVQTIRLFYDTLVRITPEGVPEPWAAENIEVTDDTTLVARLREGMTFHDGEDVTPEDVKFSFEYVLEHSETLADRASTLDSVEVTGNNEVTFNLKQPYAPFEANVLGAVFIIPEHIWSDIPESLDDIDDPTNWNNPEPVGSGPFQVDNWRQQEELQASAFENHFNPPSVDSMVRVPSANTQNLVRQLETRNLDAVVVSVQASTADRLENDVDHVTVSVSDNHGFQHIDYNLRREPFNDRAFRRALSYAVPKQQVIDAVLSGYGTIAHSHIADVNEYWHNPDVEEFTLDMDAARTTLEEAGYSWDDSGNLHKPAE